MDASETTKLLLDRIAKMKRDLIVTDRILARELRNLRTIEERFSNLEDIIVEERERKRV